MTKFYLYFWQRFWINSLMVYQTLIFAFLPPATTRGASLSTRLIPSSCRKAWPVGPLISTQISEGPWRLRSLQRKPAEAGREDKMAQWAGGALCGRSRPRKKTKQVQKDGPNTTTALAAARLSRLPPGREEVGACVSPGPCEAVSSMLAADRRQLLLSKARGSVGFGSD